jgi:hypothetical protein
MLAESVSKATINSMHIGSSHKSNFEFLRESHLLSRALFIFRQTALKS